MTCPFQGGVCGATALWDVPLGFSLTEGRAKPSLASTRTVGIFLMGFILSGKMALHQEKWGQPAGVRQRWPGSPGLTCSLEQKKVTACLKVTGPDSEP